MLNIEVGHLSNLDTGEIRYFITGAELGETKLTITTGSGDKTVSSQAYPIQVSCLSFFIYFQSLSLKILLRTAKKSLQKTTAAFFR